MTKYQEPKYCDKCQLSYFDDFCPACSHEAELKEARLIKRLGSVAYYAQKQKRALKKPIDKN